MASQTVRIGKTSHKALKDLVEQTGESIPSVLDKAIEEYRRKRFLERANAAFASLRQSSQEWQKEQEERKAWDETLSDGLEKE